MAFNMGSISKAISGSKKYLGLGNSMTRTNPIFGTQPISPTDSNLRIQPVNPAGPGTPPGVGGLPSLPDNYGFNDLAKYEEARRKQLGQDFQGQIGKLRTGVEGMYDSTLKNYQNTTAQRRAALSTTLSDTARKNFQLQNPFILEDLNSRGLFNSQTAVAQAQTQALKELELTNQDKLNTFDTSARGYEDQLSQQRLRDLAELDGAGTSANIQSQQDALDAALDLRRGQLESSLQSSQSDREEALARDLAKQQSRNSLNGSLIGAGGSIFGGLLGSGGGLGGLLGGSGAGAGGAGGAAGGIGLGGGLAIGGAGLGAMALSKAAENKYGSIGGALANPIGYQLNKAKKVTSEVKKSIKKLCFDPSTLVTMADGTQKIIRDIQLGDETKGGQVESIRISATLPGTRYLYKGVTVTGSHAVNEGGEWIRVEDSTLSVPIHGPGVVCSIVTDEHRIYVNDIEFADEHESDYYEDLTIDESLAFLNDRKYVEVTGNGN